jgi:hypothetical protein
MVLLCREKGCGQADNHAELQFAVIPISGVKIILAEVVHV